ncbi:MAG: hypothetical protein MR297_04705 [Tenericutes bacterium]|nr:hypothetical protein [Mycoplasmatota bacterium]
MKKIINFLKTDIKIINSYFLFAIILIILVCVGYSSYALFSFTKTSTNVIEGVVGDLSKSLDTSGANKPVLASNMIPVYYDKTNNVWKKADAKNSDEKNRWYSYESSGTNKGMWANAVTVTNASRSKYLNANIGTSINMNDITTMWVWIPRFNAVTPSNYNGGQQMRPGAINVTFVKQNKTAIDAFTFGNKELSGFWYGKFETSHTTLAPGQVYNNLGCSNETCSNANGIIIKPSAKILINNNVSNYFFAARSMAQENNSFGFVSSEVNIHLSKNSEWGAVAYLTQSIYGRCTSSNACTEVAYNNDTSYTTGHGGSYLISSYEKSLAASTTGTIYGIYDMSGGKGEYVMGVYADPNGKPRSGSSESYNSGFTGMLYDGTMYSGVPFPDSKYYNLYTGNSYQGHALTETSRWYGDYAGFISSNGVWFIRGSDFNKYEDNYDINGIFAHYWDFLYERGSYSSRFAITNE